MHTYLIHRNIINICYIKHIQSEIDVVICLFHSALPSSRTTLLCSIQPNVEQMNGRRHTHTHTHSKQKFIFSTVLCVLHIAPQWCMSVF